MLRTAELLPPMRPLTLGFNPLATTSLCWIGLHLLTSNLGAHQIGGRSGSPSNPAWLSVRSAGLLARLANSCLSV